MTLLYFLACTPPTPRVDAPVSLFDPASEAFFATPWPSDTRRDDDGTLALAGFPNPFDVPLLAEYIARVDQLTGFGTNSPIYLQLDGRLDPLTMPTPRESTAPGSSLILVDIDPASAYWGERIPVQWEQNAFADSVYMPENLLAVAPAYGFPLRPNTTYALLLTTASAAPADGWALSDSALRQALFPLGLAEADIAIATTFTTQDPLDELHRIATFLQQRTAPADLDGQSLELVFEHLHYTAWRTQYNSPVFTHGTPPFAVEGGGFQFDEWGEPVVSSWDPLRLAVCTPLGAEPDTGWPVVIYQHGTGGNYRTFCDSSAALEVMNRLGTEGLLGLGIDQPLHGNRPGAQSASDLAHFNLLNPDSGITNFRQGAADAIYLARSLASRAFAFRSPDGRTFRTDPDRILFMGHSQGGLTGALAAPFLGNDVHAMVLSGTGGVLSITVVERKDPLDFAALVRSLARLSDDEPLTPLHPALALIQTLVEPTDPINYAPYWFDQPGTWLGHAPVPVLLTSGTQDAATHYTTAIALAAAGRVPFVGVPATSADALALRGLGTTPLPSSANAVSFDEQVLTSGFHQWWDGTHGVVFEELDASDLYTHYLRSAADGEPILWLSNAPPPGP